MSKRSRPRVTNSFIVFITKPITLLLLLLLFIGYFTFFNSCGTSKYTGNGDTFYLKSGCGLDKPAIKGPVILHKITDSSYFHLLTNIISKIDGIESFILVKSLKKKR